MGLDSRLDTLRDPVIEVQTGGLSFLVRARSSDEKAIREVVERRGYFRKDFACGSGSWIDLGANIGAFSCLAARMGCHVDAYEPDPSSFLLLTENVKRNGFGTVVRCYQTAVTVSTTNRLPFYVNSARRNYWRNSAIKRWRGGHVTSVNAVHVDSVLPAGVDVDVKMDIEGSEMPVLEALTQKPGKRLVFEWSFDMDPSIPRFAAVIRKLHGWYGTVRYAKFDETLDTWPKSWFPPCKMVWCW